MERLRREGVVPESLSRVLFFSTPWTAACQALLSFTVVKDIRYILEFAQIHVH